MGERFLIQGGNKTRVTQLPLPSNLTKYTMLGEGPEIKPIEVEKIGNSLGVDWTQVSLDQLTMGTRVENEEHQDIVGANTEKAVRIAYSHLKEIPDYYTRLKAMEGAAESEVKPSFQKPDNEIPNTDANIRNADES